MRQHSVSWLFNLQGAIVVDTYSVMVIHPELGKKVLPIGWMPHQPADVMVEGSVGCPYPKCWRVFTRRLRTYAKVEDELQRMLQGHLNKEHAISQ